MEEFCNSREHLDWMCVNKSDHPPASELEVLSGGSILLPLKAAVKRQPERGGLAVGSA